MIKRGLLAIVFGAVAVLAFAPFDYWFIIFISYCGLLQLIANQTSKKAAIIGFCWGLGFFGVGIHWVYISIQQYGEVPPIIAVVILMLLVVYLSLYPMIFAALLQKAHSSYSFFKLVIAAPALWQITEFLRGYILTGFSWLQLGYTQVDSPLKAYLSYLGVNGLNLLIPILCGLIIYFIHLPNKQNHKTQSLGVISLFILLTGIVPFILKQFQWIETDQQRTAHFTLVQGNIEQSLKWNKNRLVTTLSDYQTLTEQSFSDTNIIIWPEAAITDLESNQQTYLKHLDQLALNANSSIILGIIDLQLQKQGYKIYNTAIVLGDKQQYQYPTVNRYNKHHLVPFGEFTPLEWLLKPIAEILNIPMSSMSPGDYIQLPLDVQGFKFTTAICYEIILPQLLWDNFTPETDFLLTISNDAWFGNSIGPWQHFQMARTRAIELGRPLIRSTNNGVTAVVAANGNVIKQIPQFEQDMLTVSLSPSVGFTIYARWGNYPYWGLTIFMLIISIYGFRKRP